MFPISDSIKTKRFPFLTLFLIGVTMYVFIQQFFAQDPLGFIAQNALIPIKINFGNFHTLTPFVTAIFLHGGLLHILSNMWFLWIFGDNVEDALSPAVFLILYIFAGVTGNIVQYFLMPGSDIPILGASGAIAGILGCYFILFPKAKITTILILVIIPLLIDISAPIMLGYWFVLQILAGATSLPFTASTGGIAFWAHIVGFIIGIFFGIMYKRRVELQNFETGYNEG